MKDLFVSLITVIYCINLDAQPILQVDTVTSNNIVGASIRIACDGAYYACGYFEDSVDFGFGGKTFKSKTFGNVEEGYVAKYDQNDNVVWVRKLHSVGLARIRDIVIDVDQNIYGVGFVEGTAFFDSDTARLDTVFDNKGNPSLSNCMVVFKLDSDGKVLWHNTPTERQTDNSGFLGGVKLDGKDNVIISGDYHERVNWDPALIAPTLISPISITSNDNAFFAKFTKDGQFVWQKEFKSEQGLDQVFDILVGRRDAIYIAGVCFGRMDFNPNGTSTIIGDTLEYTPYVAKLDSNGDFQWGYAPEPDPLRGVNVIVSSISHHKDGSINWNLGFDNQVILGPAPFDTIFARSGQVLLKISATGNVIDTTVFRRNSIFGKPTLIADHIVDDSNNLLVSVAFSGGGIANISGVNIPVSGSILTGQFLFKMDSVRKYKWHLPVHIIGNGAHGEIDINSSGDMVFIGGMFGPMLRRFLSKYKYVGYDVTPHWGDVIGSDFDTCVSPPLILSVMDTVKNDSYQWSTGSNSDSTLVDSSGTYYVTASKECFSKMDTINIKISEAKSVELGTDLDTCVSSILIKAKELDTVSSYLWNNGDTTADIQVESSGIYILQSFSPCGNSSDTIEVRLGSPISANLPDSILACDEKSHKILRPTNFNTIYRWQDGTTGEAFEVSQSGKVFLTAYNRCDTLVDSTVVKFGKQYDKLLPEDSLVCGPFQKDIDLTNTSGRISWNNGDTISRLTINAEGVYWVSLDDNGCLSSDTLYIKRDAGFCESVSCFSWPNIVTPNGDLVNDQFLPILYCDCEDYSMQIFNRWGQLLFASELNGEGWDCSINGRAASAGTYFYTCSYSLNHNSMVQKGGFTIAR